VHGESSRPQFPLPARGETRHVRRRHVVQLTPLPITVDPGALLDPHLATQEAEVIPHLRAMKSFPAPASAEEAEMLTQGFAWACHGIAPEVLRQVYTMLSPDVSARLPAARAAFEQRWRRVWGPGAEVGASFTPFPRPIERASR
jgi:hypothetical protein